MERLTIEYCGEYVPKALCGIDRLGGADDCDLCCEYCKATEEGDEDCRGCAINQCFNRLGQYENTGLTPEEILDGKLLTGWIMCSEKLPGKKEYLKDDGRFIVTDGKRCYQSFYDIYNCNFKTVRHVQGNICDFSIDNRIVAWMPLPVFYEES